MSYICVESAVNASQIALSRSFPIRQNQTLRDPEQCDKGSSNSANAYGPGLCTNLCTLAPYCGDGRVNGNEQCDGQVGCSPQCTIINWVVAIRLYIPLRPQLARRGERLQIGSKLLVMNSRIWTTNLVSLAVVMILQGSTAAGVRADLRVPISNWRVVKRESGPINYYTLHPEAEPPYIRGNYHSPLETVVLGYQVPDDDRARVKFLHWKWRAVTLPEGGNECAKGKGDSAAVIYVSWRRFLRWYAVKYVWSSVGPKGAVCDKKSNPFMAQDTVILESGAPLGTWRDEAIDLDAEFRKHFADNDPKASVPDFMGVGLMTDGDQTQSDSAADYADFYLRRR